MSEFLNLHGTTNKTVRALAERRMQRHGLHLGQDHLLAQLWNRDGQTPGEIANATDVSTPAVVKMATRMVAGGWITRRPDEHDNRLVRLWLTNTGRSLQAPVERERRQLDAALTADLSPDDRVKLISLLAAVHETGLRLLAQ